jgi:TetR/AcrR family transcriptional regulator, cholesterol catabolism regulator
VSSNQQNGSAAPRPARRRVAGAKRDEILAAATERFGRDGYEDTRWADIAADVGVGATALYHYFESKQHCLFVIMAEAIAGFHGRFVRTTAIESDFLRALDQVFDDAFALTPLDVQRQRVLVAEQGLLAHPRSSPREEQARQAARARARDLEFAWATFLARAMERGALPEGDPRLLVRAVLGLYNSIWQWYRPDGVISLESVARFYRTSLFGLLGFDPAGSHQYSRPERRT